MSRLQLDALLDECADTLDRVDRDHLREELGSLLGYVDATPPAPSAELAAVLGLPAPAEPGLATVLPLQAGGTDPEGPAPRGRLTGPRGAVTGVVVLAAATVGATGLSAAANSLPAPLQRHVADLSHTYLPFDFPRPRGVLDRDPTSPERPASGAEPLAPPSPPAPTADRPTREDARVPTEVTRGDDTVRTPPPAEALAGARVVGSSRDSTPAPARPAATPRPTSAPSPTASASSGTRPQGGTSSSPPRSSPTPGSEPRGDGSTSPRKGSASPAPSLAASASPRPGQGQSQGPDQGPKQGQGPNQGQGGGRTKDGSLPGKDPVKEQRERDLREKDAREPSGTAEPGWASDVVAPVTDPLGRTLDGALDRVVDGPDGSLPAR